MSDECILSPCCHSEVVRLDGWFHCKGCGAKSLRNPHSPQQFDEATNGWRCRCQKWLGRHSLVGESSR
jgi:hypothetical protein